MNYLEAPYNVRHYGANYHLFNTIAKYDIFVLKGKTRLCHDTKNEKLPEV
mgnify:CR=1 FL=1